MLPPIDLNSLIQAITGIASPVLKDKLQRNETVIKILQKFNLAPEHPPSDFSGIYAYALVEYGVGKPQLFLELFRDQEIKKAFRPKRARFANVEHLIITTLQLFSQK